MNKPNILEKIDELFGDPQAPDMQKLELLISETLRFFEYIRAQMQSPKEEDRKEAIEMAQKLQQKLEGLADKSLASSGMSRDQLYTLLSNPNNFSGEEWQKFKTAEKEISDYRKDILKDPETKASALKPSNIKTSKKEWLKS